LVTGCLRTPPTPVVTSVAVDNAGGLWVLLQNDDRPGLYHSPDRGLTFELKRPGEFTDLEVGRSGQALWLDGTLWINGGVDFTPAPAGAVSAAFDPLEIQHVVLAADPPLVSIDGGRKFTPSIMAAPGLTHITHVVIGAAGTVWAFGDDGIALSTDYGFHFANVRSGGPYDVMEPASGPLWVRPSLGVCDDGTSVSGWCLLGDQGQLTVAPAPHMAQLFLGVDDFGRLASDPTDLALSSDDGVTFSEVGAFPECPDGSDTGGTEIPEPEDPTMDDDGDDDPNYGPKTGAAGLEERGLLFLGGSCGDGTVLWATDDDGVTYHVITASQIAGGG
jgi:hypothetical protein